MNPFAAFAIKLAIVLGCLYGMYHHGYKAAAEHYQGMIEKAAKQTAERMAGLIQEARDDERAKAAAMHTIDADLLEKQQHEINSRDAVIADLRSGAVSLRKRFTCAAAGNERVPSTATSTSSGDAVQAGGLQQQDAEFFVRLASEADQVTRQLQACQAVVRSDRQVRP